MVSGSSPIKFVFLALDRHGHRFYAEFYAEGI